MITPSELRKEANRHRKAARIYLIVCKILFVIMLTLLACSTWNPAEGSVKYFGDGALCIMAIILFVVQKVSFHEMKRIELLNKLRSFKKVQEEGLRKILNRIV